MILPIALFELWLLSITLFYELSLTGFGRYMPVRLSPSFYAYYAILVMGACMAYWSGVTSPSPKIKVSTKLASGIPLALQAVQIFSLEIYHTPSGWSPLLQALAIAGLLSAIAIWLIITAKHLLSESKGHIKTRASHTLRETQKYTDVRS